MTAGNFHKREHKSHQRQSMLRRQLFKTGKCWVLLGNLVPNKQMPSRMTRTVICSCEGQFNIHNTYRVRNYDSHDAEHTNHQSSTIAGKISYRKIYLSSYLTGLRAKTRLAQKRNCSRRAKPGGPRHDGALLFCHRLLHIVFFYNTSLNSLLL